MTTDRFKFTRHDLWRIIVDPRGSAKAFAAGASALLIQYLAGHGLSLPDEIALEVGQAFEVMLYSAFAFAVTWISPNARRVDRTDTGKPAGLFIPSLGRDQFRDEA